MYQQPCGAIPYGSSGAQTPNVRLCLNEKAGLVDSDGSAEDFFDTEGNLAPATRVMLELLTAFERSRLTAELAAAALSDAGVLSTWTLDVRLNGQAVPPLDILRVDEDALNALDDAAFLKLRHASALPLTHLQLLSANQTTVFEQLSLKQRHFSQARPAATPDYIAR